MVGQRFGKLLVTEELTERLAGSKQYECICDCGRKHVTKGTTLRSGKINSCGCLKAETNRRNGQKRRKDVYENAFNTLYRSYVHGAIRRNLDFNLNKEEFLVLTQSNCFYCNQLPQNEMKIKRSYSLYIYNGIDRIDNNLGYSISNCVSCCGICNFMKRDMNFIDFVQRIKSIATNLNKKDL